MGELFGAVGMLAEMGDDASAFADESTNDLAADASGGTRDEDNLVGKFGIHGR